jgi:hypothetical protein
MELRRVLSSRWALVAGAGALVVVAWLAAWLLVAGAVLAALGAAVVRTGLFDELRPSRTELDDWD